MSYEDFKNKKSLNLGKDWNELALKQFSGFDLHPYDAYLVTPFALVFITRPKLFIKSSTGGADDKLENIAYKNMALHPYLSRFIKDNVQNSKDTLIADLLSYSNNTANSSEINNLSFIPILTNRIRNFAVEPNSFNTAEQGNTKHGYRHIFPTHNVASMANGNFSFELNEMKDLEISNLFGIWYNTILGMITGELRANPNMIRDNRLDYVSSVYYFKLDRDAQTIKYWAKYNGVFPTNNPSEPFSWQASSTSLTTVSANFSYDSREELTLSILDDFNTTSMGFNSTELISNMSTFNLEMFEKVNVLKRADNLADKVPLIYYVDDTKATDLKPKRRFVLKFGKDSVYESASETMFGAIGHLGQRDSLYKQQDEE